MPRAGTPPLVSPAISGVEGYKRTMRAAVSRTIVVATAGLSLAGCANDFGWGWHVVSPTNPAGLNNLKFLASGFLTTVQIAVCAAIGSMALGLIVAVCAFSRYPVLRAFNRTYVEIFRAASVLVVVLWIFYGLPVVLGIRLDVFAAATLALLLCDSPFEAEIFRGGIQSIDKGQREAALSLGLSPTQAFITVILPQAIRRVLPPIGNQFVYLVKMSSLASVIGAAELTRKANELTVTVFRPLEIYTILLLEYLALVLTISWAVRRLETYLAASDRGVAPKR